MSECSHDCSSCSESCGERKQESFLAPLNEHSSVKKVVAVVSGKGGVGKSLVTELLSVISQQNGLKTAILDADITGPSIPKAFGIKQKAEGGDFGIYPVKSKTGIDIMSVNLLLPDDTDPVIWRGPIIGGTVKQFWTDVVWGDVDLMFIDCPPGTGDVALTVFQSIPVDGIIVVTSPQDLVSMIVGKAVKMAKMMNIPIIGIVENMSYFKCPNCSETHYIYGKSHINEIAKEYGIKNIAKMPIDANLSAAVDAGMVEMFNEPWIDEMFEKIDEIKK